MKGRSENIHEEILTMLSIYTPGLTNFEKAISLSLQSIDSAPGFGIIAIEYTKTGLVSDMFTY